jgi:hypothetical protein
MIWALILCPNYRGRHFVSYMPDELLSFHRSPKRTIFSKWEYVNLASDKAFITMPKVSVMVCLCLC